jgi:Protein of unknown function (DUF2997)
MKRIKITIAKDGTQRVEVLGAQGTECIKFTEKLEQRLGVPVGERTLKPECELECESEHIREQEQQREIDG